MCEVYEYHYDVTCPECGADLRQEGAVTVSFSNGDRVTHEDPSQLDEDGKLLDPSGMVAAGYHAGTECTKCKENLD